MHLLKFYVVNLIVLLLHCDCPRRFEIVLLLRSNDMNDMFSRFFVFLTYMKVICFFEKLQFIITQFDPVIFKF